MTVIPANIPNFKVLQMTTVLKIKIVKMFPLLVVNEDLSYKIALAWDQKWAIITTEIVTSLNSIISQGNQARN